MDDGVDVDDGHREDRRHGAAAGGKVVALHRQDGEEDHAEEDRDDPQPRAKGAAEGNLQPVDPKVVVLAPQRRNADEHHDGEERFHDLVEPGDRPDLEVAREHVDEEDREERHETGDGDRAQDEAEDAVDAGENADHWPITMLGSIVEAAGQTHTRTSTATMPKK